MEKMLIIQFHTKGKILVIKLYSLEKILMMLFSDNFVDKKIDEKDQFLIPVFGKNACY